ncbi:serine carboxypeptidase-like protein 1 [Cinnamomum micranthum f. kanehirae]|uniref:Serine carboxypeptidase-like protein 1 n=1 Tax=Cinnamomum micranthum f. kanehirae TaxID=337451 RepID=A0A3S3MPM0_9MAGN|nr:serine carboxypeptidase-like protein 1 [Cinnamomum micranthum f. kanehirae]
MSWMTGWIHFLDLTMHLILVHLFTSWLDSHPQFVSNPLYIGGDSYSGLTLPVVVQEIANGKEAGHEPIVNLKGYLLGNPGTDYKIDTNAVVPYLHGMGIISDELYESSKKNCDNDYYSNVGHSLCSKDLEKINELLSEIDEAAILEPKCPFAAPRPMEVGDHRRALEVNSSRFILPQPQPTFGCREYSYLLCYYYANNDSVRKALHIRKARTFYLY